MAKIGCDVVVVVTTMTMTMMMMMMMMSTNSSSSSSSDLELAAAGGGDDDGLNCGTVIQALSPCLGYIRSGGKKPVPACCNGVRFLKNVAVTTPDRQTACTCLKQIATGVSPAIVALAASIPTKCGVPIPYNIDPTTDCSKVR